MKIKYLDYDKIAPFLDKINHFKPNFNLMTFDKDHGCIFPKNLTNIRKEYKGWYILVDISFKEKIPDLPSGKYVITLSDLHIFYPMRDLEAMMSIPDLLDDERVEEIKRNPKSRKSIATDLRNMLLCVPIIEDVDDFMERCRSYRPGTLGGDALLGEYVRKWDAMPKMKSETLAMYDKAKYRRGSGMAISYSAERARFAELMEEFLLNVKRVLEGREEYLDGFGKMEDPRNLSFRASWITLMQTCIESFVDFRMKYDEYDKDVKRYSDRYRRRKLVFGNGSVPTGEIPVFVFDYMRYADDYRLYPPTFSHIMLYDDIKLRRILMDEMKEAMVRKAKSLGHRKAEEFERDDRLAELYARYVMGVIATAKDMFPEGVEGMNGLLLSTGSLWDAILNTVPYADLLPSKVKPTENGVPIFEGENDVQSKVAENLNEKLKLYLREEELKPEKVEKALENAVRDISIGKTLLALAYEEGVLKKEKTESYRLDGEGKRNFGVSDIGR